MSWVFSCSSLGLCLITLASTDMGIGQRCPLGSPFYLETINLKKQNKGHSTLCLSSLAFTVSYSPPFCSSVHQEMHSFLRQWGALKKEIALSQMLSPRSWLALLLSSRWSEDLLGLGHSDLNLDGLVFPALFHMLILLTSFGSHGEQSKLGCYMQN